MFGAYYFLTQKFRHAIVCEYLFDPYLSNIQPSKSKAPISRPFHSRIFNSLEVLKGFFFLLQPGSNEKNQKDFLSEASIMGQFNHPNVIALKGVVTQSRSAVISQATVNDFEEHWTLMAKPTNFKSFLSMSRFRGRRLRATATPPPSAVLLVFSACTVTQ